MSDFADRKLNEILDLEAEIEQRQFKATDHTSAPTQEKFGLANYESRELNVVELTPEQDKDDAELARASIRNVLEISNKNLEGIFELAKASEHPRAFAIAVEMSKSIVDSAVKLNDLVNKKGDAQLKTSPTGLVTNNQQVNQHFYGSTEEALRAMRDSKKNLIQDDPEN